MTSVKEFVAAFASEQKNVEMCPVGESLVTCDELSNIICKAIAAVNGRVWCSRSLSAFLDDRHGVPSHIKELQVASLEHKVRFFFSFSFWTLLLLFHVFTKLLSIFVSSLYVFHNKLPLI